MTDEPKEPANCPYCGSETIATTHQLTDEWWCRCYDCDRVAKIDSIEI